MRQPRCDSSYARTFALYAPPSSRMANRERSRATEGQPLARFFRNDVVCAGIGNRRGPGSFPEPQHGVGSYDALFVSLGLGAGGRVVDQPALERKAAKAFGRSNFL